MEKTYNPLQTISIPANADMSDLHRFVKISSGKLVYCGENEKAIGVLALEAEAGRAAAVHVYGIVLVEAGTGGVTENTPITSDEDGKAVAIEEVAVEASAATGAVAVKSDAENPTLTATVSGGILPVAINGIALETVLAGELVRVKLL